jgi:UDP-N-acetylglucosamine--N-acetylmuramyl-(pentapeptide) pyrophosphoryl-undecaprenol N-acetylglucosamine transferase
MKVLLAGGGTGGPVIPLIAVAEEIRKDNPAAEFLFVGTKNGPEREMVASRGFAFESVPSAKLRRYFSLRNFFDVFVFAGALAKSFSLLKRTRPDVIFSAGGFVAVPICWAARLLKIKIVIHQQDARPGLANKLVSPFADVITAAFEETTKRFYTNAGIHANEKVRQIEWVGNPVRRDFFDQSLPYKDFFRLHDKLPILFIMGGATGAKQINDVTEGALPELVKAHQVVHVTGKGKNSITFEHPDYRSYEFLGKELPTIMKMADIVVSRAGLSTIAELSALGKISVIVPMPGSHQEENADILKRRAAAVVLNSEEFTSENLVRVINSLKFNVARQNLLKRNISELMPKDSSEKLAKIILDVYAKRN